MFGGNRCNVGMVVLDDERKAAMVSNLLVTLCAEQPMQPDGSESA